MLASSHWPCRRNAFARSCRAGSFARLTLKPGMIPAFIRACASATTRCASFSTCCCCWFFSINVSTWLAVLATWFTASTTALLYFAMERLFCALAISRLAFRRPLSKIGSVSPAVTPIWLAELRNKSLKCSASCCRKAIRLMSG